MLFKNLLVTTMAIGFSGTTFGEVKADSTHIHSSQNQDEIMKNTQAKVIGKAASGIGRGGLGDIRLLSITKANHQYYLQDTSRGATIITMDGHNRDDIRPIIWRNADNTFYDVKDAIAVDAHYNMGIVYDYFKEKYGRDSYDGKGGTIYSYVRMGDFADSTWGGDSAIFGNGNTDDDIKTRGFSSALDLVGHEFTHGIIENTSRLKYQGESGALNEAIADLFGILIKHDYDKKSKSKRNLNYKIAEDIYIDGTNSLRSMKNPSSVPISNNTGFKEPLIDDEGKQHTQYPDHYSNVYKGTQDHGGVHFNSSIINKASYLLCGGGTHYGIHVQGIGEEATGKIYYLATTEFLKENTNFAEARIALEKAAVQLYGQNSKEVKSVQSAYSAVGIR
ncbi:bacillolysin (plasmid) [Bacillus thuringiensis]|uniref:Neutral metalloproteinase n=1 Tax=Bacillus thuringiensis TaxID=1428 RepID=A0A9W3X3Z8_BACTU|nr:M4 family metallopeptidase [Bacillus thuringiensis]ANS52051.1 bacillolysin [Bacillus thuringiensis]